MYLFTTKLFCYVITPHLIGGISKKYLNNSLIWKTILINHFTTTSRLGVALTTINAAKTLKTDGFLTKLQANEIAANLTSKERNLLFTALEEYDAKVIRNEYLRQLEAGGSRSKLGRPCKLPTLADMIDSSTSSPIPEDLFERHITKPTAKKLIGLCIANAIPFICFGFLDNVIMITAGDYIHITLGWLVSRKNTQSNLHREKADLRYLRLYCSLQRIPTLEYR